MISWPDSLIRELAQRRCVVFLGAGASAGSKSADGSKSPPNWKDFLERLLVKVTDIDSKSFAESLISDQRYLDAAEVILAKIPRADFSTFIRDELVTPRFQPSHIHEVVLEIDPKIVVTTNYDDIYDIYCRAGDAQHGYNVCRYYETHLVSDIRSPVRVVVKAHGCVSNPQQIVLARSQYYRQRRTFASFFRVLDGLFLTSTILFIGYSLTDPDIQLLLENASIVAPQSHPHYAVLPDNVNGAIRRAWEEAYNIEFLTYSAGDYTELNASLDILLESVLSYRATYVS